MQGKASAAPDDGGVDLAVAGVAVVVVSLAVAASCVVVSFDARARRQPGARLRRVLDLGPSMRGARLLLAFSAGLFAAAETLRLPLLRRVSMSAAPCLAYPLVAHGVAEPCFLATVLLLLRAASTGGGGAARLPASATLAVPLVCLPFLTGHVAVLVVAAPASRAVADADAGAQCAYPAYAAALVLALVAVYAPLLASACWTVAAVAINRRMRARAYALAALVVAPLAVQVVAIALTSVWGRASSSSQAVFGLVGFLAVGVAAAAALAILVLMPVYDALVLGEEDEQLLPVVATGDSEDARELGR